jgi:hypothetical protein
MSDNFEVYGATNWKALMPAREPTTILKRVAKPMKETTPMNNLAQLQHDAERAINEGRDDAEFLLSKFEKAVRHRVTVTSHDDGDQEDDWSEPANARASGNNASDEDDDEEDNGDEQEEPDDDDDEEDQPVRKAGFPYGTSNLGGSGRSGMYPGLGSNTGVYPETQTNTPTTPKFLIRADRIRLRDGTSRNAALQQAKKEHPQDFAAFQQWRDKSPSVAKAANGGFDPLQPRGKTSTHSPHPYRTATWAATQAPKRSPEWDDFVDSIVERDGGTRTSAMQTARRERPDLYARYQAWFSGTSAQNQQATRSATDGVFKRNSTPFYEDLVAAEMRKGASNLVVAQRRVIQAYGGAIMKHSAILNKGVDVVEQFNAKVSDIVDEGFGLLEATEIAARENPRLMKFMR